MKEKLETLLVEAKEIIDKATEEVEMNLIKSKYFGKQSEFTSIMKEMATLTPEEKKNIGETIGLVFKDYLESIKIKNK